ncbi:MAG TPA: 2-amino-4-hydroxy-6-hydroxymethyldihydropteridine diphosphokinase, partial [Thermoguttaceae bacterium]
MARCLIGLGSNLGNRREMLERALAELRGHSQIQVIAVSSFHETAPIGGPAGQPFYLNAVAALDCSLPPDGLLQLLEQIELKHGRRREETWGPRTLDLDLLLYEDIVLSTPRLELPHPRMAWRRFVLEPAAEVAQDVLHPTIGWTIGRLLEHLNTALPYVAITGTIATGKTQLAGILCEKISARLISESIDENLLETFYADPAGHAWTMELEFLGERTTLLSSDAVIWSEHSQWVVSDFWFDQSPGFARAWLDQSQWPAYQELWQQARQKVVGPKLLVLLDAPSEVLLDRISRRARCGEQNLNPAQLERIRQSILD